MNPLIRRYLDEHGATYTPEALRRGLLDAGYDPAEVDRALDEWRTANASPSDAADGSVLRRLSILIHAAALAVVAIVLLVMYGPEQSGTVLTVGIVLGLALLIGWAISWRIGRRLLPRTGLAFALVAPIVSALLLGGSCLALIRGVSGPPPRPGTVELHITAPQALDATGSASCFGEPTITSITAQDLGTIDERTVFVIVNLGLHPDQPREVFIDLQPRSETDTGLSFSNGGGGTIDIRAEPDGRAGTVAFDGLRAQEYGPEASQPGEARSITGTVTWTCE
jgi:hypothetical protein